MIPKNISYEGLKKQGYDTETIVDSIDSSLDKHLESVVLLISNNETGELI